MPSWDCLLLFPKGGLVYDQSEVIRMTRNIVFGQIDDDDRVTKACEIIAGQVSRSDDAKQTHFEQYFLGDRMVPAQSAGLGTMQFSMIREGLLPFGNGLSYLFF